jgi:hypothetical protein
MLDSFVRVNIWRWFLDVRNICKGKYCRRFIAVRSICIGNILEVVSRC